MQSNKVLHSLRTMDDSYGNDFYNFLLIKDLLKNLITFVHKSMHE